MAASGSNITRLTAILVKTILANEHGSCTAVRLKVTHCSAEELLLSIAHKINLNNNNNNNKILKKRTNNACCNSSSISTQKRHSLQWITSTYERMPRFKPSNASSNNSIITREAVYFSRDPWVWRLLEKRDLSLTGGRNILSDVLPEVKALSWLPDWQITMVLKALVTAVDSKVRILKSTVECSAEDRLLWLSNAIELGYSWTTISWSFISQVCGQWKAPWDNNEERKVGYILNKDS